MDVGLLRRVKNQVKALHEHLVDIEDEMASVMTHLVALESILEGARIPACFTLTPNSSLLIHGVDGEKCRAMLNQPNQSKLSQY